MEKVSPRVAIIGGGPAGLVAAKECLAHGLHPVVFEARKNHSGLWCAFNGMVWPDMRVNISKDSTAFPDQAWHTDDSLFPNQLRVTQYLQDYAEKFKLHERADMRMESHVTSVSSTDRGWDVSTNGRTERFTHVICASGFFSQPYMPEVAQSDARAVHSSQIKPFSAYAGRKVMVVGNGFSGCDIAVGLSKAGANVQHVFRRPYQIVPRVFENGQSIDEMFYRYRGDDVSRDCDPVAKDRAKKQFLIELLGDQSDVHPLLALNANDDAPALVSVATGYLESVKSGAIHLVKSDITEVDIPDDVDDIVFATGFKTDLSYLNSSVLDAMHYNGNDRFMPIPLHEGVWAENQSNLGFVGMYRGPFFLSMALQAQWIAKSFSNSLSFKPAESEVNKGVQDALALRRMNPQLQFPYGDYPALIERLSQYVVDYSYLKRGGQRIVANDFRRLEVF